MERKCGAVAGAVCGIGAVNGGFDFGVARTRCSSAEPFRDCRGVGGNDYGCRAGTAEYTIGGETAERGVRLDDASSRIFVGATAARVAGGVAICIETAPRKVAQGSGGFGDCGVSDDPRGVGGSGAKLGEGSKRYTRAQRRRLACAESVIAISRESIPKICSRYSGHGRVAAGAY